MKWTVKEDEIVVRYYLRHVTDWSRHMSECMAELRAAGFPLRDESSTRMRVGNVESVHTHGMRGLCHPANQTVDVYHKITGR